MINRYGFLLAILCTFISSLQAMEEESQADWEYTSSFLANIKELDIPNFRCPDNQKTNEPSNIDNSKPIPLISFTKLKNVKEKKPTPRYTNGKKKELINSKIHNDIVHSDFTVPKKNKNGKKKEDAPEIPEVDVSVSSDVDIFNVLLKKAIVVNAKNEKLSHN